MTEILKKAWNTLERLPDEKQDYIAHLIMAELEDENLWDKKFTESSHRLSRIAQNVRKDIKAGKVLEFDFG